MMQQELCYQPNFGKVTTLSLSRRVVALIIALERMRTAIVGEAVGGVMGENLLLERVIAENSLTASTAYLANRRALLAMLLI